MPPLFAQSAVSPSLTRLAGPIRPLAVKPLPLAQRPVEIAAAWIGRALLEAARDEQNSSFGIAFL